MQFSRRAALAALPGLAMPYAWAQANWPRQAIRFVVPFAPGGTSEIVARTVAQELTRQLGQTVYVDNKGGGAGLPAMAEVAKAAPDGHTIILGHVGSLAVNPTIFANQPYDEGRVAVFGTLLPFVALSFVALPCAAAATGQTPAQGMAGMRRGWSDLYLRLLPLEQTPGLRRKCSIKWAVRYR